MILNIEHVLPPMKRVYDLERELKEDPEQVALAQALTLDKGRPLMGLKGSGGLFGSAEWWDSIITGRIQTKVVSGTIERTYFAGQDSRWGDEVNSFTMKQDDGSLIDESIYTNERRDAKLFVPGARVFVAYALDELKAQPGPNGGVNYLDIVLEVAISRRPTRS